MASTSLTQATLAETLWTAEDRGSRALRAVVLALVGTGILWASAKINIPFWPVPMTMQTFAVLVIGMAYGWRLGAATVLAYLVEGAVGLPVFANGGGLAYFAGPTTGYLLGFVASAALVGWLAERGWDRSATRTLAAMVLGTAVIFAGGVAWLAPFLATVKGLAGWTALQAAVANGVAPFLLGAAFKIGLATAILPLAWKGVAKRG